MCNSLLFNPSSSIIPNHHEISSSTQVQKTHSHPLTRNPRAAPDASLHETSSQNTQLCRDAMTRTGKPTIYQTRHSACDPAIQPSKNPTPLPDRLARDQQQHRASSPPFPNTKLPGSRSFVSHYRSPTRTNAVSVVSGENPTLHRLQLRLSAH